MNYCTTQDGLWDVTFWDGSKLIGCAENIVAPDKDQAVKRGVRAMSHRSKQQKHLRQFVQLKKHVDMPNCCQAPDGVRVFAARKERGVKVIG